MDRERWIQTDRWTERETNTDGQRERRIIDTDEQRERDGYRQTDRQRETDTERQMDRERRIQTDR